MQHTTVLYTSFPNALFSPYAERRRPRNKRGKREGNLGRSTLVIHQMRPLLPPLASTQTAVGPCLLNLPREGESTGNWVTDLAQGPDLKVHLTEEEEELEQLPHQNKAQGKHGGRSDTTNLSQTDQEHPHQSTTNLGDKEESTLTDLDLVLLGATPPDLDQDLQVQEERRLHMLVLFHPQGSMGNSTRTRQSVMPEGRFHSLHLVIIQIRGQRNIHTSLLSSSVYI